MNIIADITIDQLLRLATLGVTIATFIGIIVGLFKINTIHLIINSRFDAFMKERSESSFAKGAKSVTDAQQAADKEFNKGVEAERKGTTGPIHLP
jgi:hypothetical protein